MRRFLRVPVICIVLLAMLGPPIVAASPIRVDCASDPAALSEAVAAASPGAMLVISGTCVGNLVLDKDLTIVGGSEDATLTGEPHVGVLRVSSSAVVSLSNVAVKMWGAEPSVIQLRNEGTLTLTDVTISHGPVDAIRNGGSLTLRHSTVTDNRGKGDAPITNVGGTVTIIQSLITRNRNTEVIAAIVNSEGGTVTLIGSTVSDNSGYTEVVRNAGTMTLVNSVFTGNVAGRADLRNRGTLSLTDSVVSDNEVWNAASGCSEGCAGGIENYGTLLVRGSEVQGNRGGRVVASTTPGR